MDFTQDELANEVWRGIVGFPRYEVSNLGRVRSISYMRTGNVKILKQYKKVGYFQVCLMLNGRANYRQIGRLVALTFIPNPENKPCVDHIDTNKENNRVENLRWVTYKENMNNPLTYEKCLKAAKHKNLGKKASEETRRKLSEINRGQGNGFYGKKHTEDTLAKIRASKASESHLRKVLKPISQFTLDGVKIKDWPCAKYAARELNVKDSSIVSVILGRKKSCKGFLWRRAENPTEVLDNYFKERNGNNRDSTPTAEAVTQVE